VRVSLEETHDEGRHRIAPSSSAAWHVEPLPPAATSAGDGVEWFASLEAFVASRTRGAASKLARRPGPARGRTSTSSVKAANAFFVLQALLPRVPADIGVP